MGLNTSPAGVGRGRHPRMQNIRKFRYHIDFNPLICLVGESRGRESLGKATTFRPQPAAAKALFGQPVRFGSSLRTNIPFQPPHETYAAQRTPRHRRRYCCSCRRKAKFRQIARVRAVRCWGIVPPLKAHSRSRQIAVGWPGREDHKTGGSAPTPTKTWCWEGSPAASFVIFHTRP